jgi:hypothetical protein|tara:strand:- start:235 stop:738 length:504 start_codon:yes stop_codon:yes gene_type:complete
MIYLNTASSAQTFTFIPSKFVISANIKVTDEETGLHQTKLVGISKLNNLGSISVALNLKEGKFYRLQITSLGSNWDTVGQNWNLVGINWEEALTPVGASWSTAQEEWEVTSGKWNDVREPVTQVIYTDRIFCTDQTISQRSQEYYNINEGIYKKSQSGDNTYKVYNA